MCLAHEKCYICLDVYDGLSANNNRPHKYSKLVLKVGTHTEFEIVPLQTGSEARRASGAGPRLCEVEQD